MSDTVSQPTSIQPTSKTLRFRGVGWRFASVAVLTVVMFVPLIAVSFVIQDRAHYQKSAVHEVSQLWGGPITLSGPFLIIPVERERTRTVKDEDGVTRTETFTERANPVILMPETLDVSANSTSDIRTRGIFEIPVFSADLEIGFRFDTDRVANVMRGKETVLWDKASLAMFMPRTRSFSGHAMLSAGTRKLDLEPGTPGGHGSGIQAELGDPRSIGNMQLTMGLNGADRMTFAPAGRETTVRMASDWPHPSFDGTFLPKDREITPEGFTATWEVPHLARDIPQVARGEAQLGAEFGVSFYNPVDFYQKVERAAKYGILFIALTFVTVLLTERLSGRPAHPVQFLLIGVAQCIFFLLLLSFSEQIGFAAAYLVAGGATIGLIGMYGMTGLGLGRHVRVLVGALVTLYATLFMILRSTDYALLAGSVLAFVALALVMILFRREDWFPEPVETAPESA